MKCWYYGYNQYNNGDYGSCQCIASGDGSSEYNPGNDGSGEFIAGCSGSMLAMMVVMVLVKTLQVEMVTSHALIRTITTSNT